MDKRVGFLVGPRFRYDDVRAGSGSTIVLEQDGAHWKDLGPDRWITLPKPISGPIVKMSTDDKEYYALCDQCGRTSRHYKRKNEPHMRKWASMHRCKETQRAERKGQ